MKNRIVIIDDYSKIDNAQVEYLVGRTKSINYEIVNGYLSSGLACYVYQMSKDDLEYISRVNADAYLDAIEELENFK